MNPDGSVQSKGGLQTQVTNFSFPTIITSEDKPSITVMKTPTDMKKDISKLLSSSNLKASRPISTTALLEPHKFVLPRNGIFIMTNPAFNNDGDFLVDIKYEPAQTN